MKEPLEHKRAGVWLVHLPVEIIRTLAELQGVTQRSGTDGEGAASVAEALTDASPSLLDRNDSVTNLLAGHRAVRNGVDETVLAGIEVVEFTGEVRVKLTDSLLLAVQGVVQLAGDLVREGGWQGHGSHVTFDCSFDECDGEVWQVAEAFLPSAAQVVRVEVS